MGKFSDLAKQGLRYQPLDEDSQQQAAPEKEQGDFSRGFEKAMLQVPQTLGGAAALVGDLAGSEGLKEYGLNVYEKNSDKIQAITKDSDSLSNVLEGDASGAAWLKNTGGYVAGQAVQALATGGVGGFIGSQLAKRGISGVVARGANSLAAREVASKVAAKGAKWGAGTALLGNNLAQEAGSIYPEALNEAAKEGRELTGEDKARVVGSSIAAAGVDTAMDALMMGRVLKGARKTGESMLRAGVREVPGAMAREGVTEGIQTGIERYGAGQELSTADAIRDYVDSVGVGLVGGGAGGAASVIRANRQVPESGPLTRAANISTEQTILQLENNPQPLIAFPDGTVGTEAEKQAFLSQFTDPEERQRVERQMMGRDPETGKRIEPPKEEPAKSAESPEAEAQALAEWGAQHDPVPLEQAHALLAAPGTKGENLMVAPHPSGEGFTLVPAEWLTLDSQARHAELQKPAKPTAKGKSDAVPATAETGRADGNNVADTQSAAAVATPEPGVSGAVPDVDAAPDAPALSEPEWKTNPYTARKFANREGAETFMKNKGADPALFEAREIEDGKFAIKRRATPAPTTTEGAPDAGDNAVLAAPDGAARGTGDQPADPAGSGEAGAGVAVTGQPGESGAAIDGAGATVQPDPVRAAGSADADPALTAAPAWRDKLIPAMSDAELEQAIAHYGPTHKRTPKLQKALDNRRAKADPDAKKADWRQATADKEAKLAEQLKTANDNAAARATPAKEEAADVSERPQVPEEAPPASGAESAPEAAAAPAASGQDGGVSDIPLAFYAKVRVKVDVFNEETGVTTQEEIPADQALAAVNDDIDNLTALLKCMKG